MSDIRINACLDEQIADDLNFLRKALGEKSTTEVLEYSVRQAAKNLREQAEARKQKDIWRRSGLIGCIEDGPEDLSISYKKDFGDYFAETPLSQVDYDSSK